MGLQSDWTHLSGIIVNETFVLQCGMLAVWSVLSMLLHMITQDNGHRTDMINNSRRHSCSRANGGFHSQPPSWSAWSGKRYAVLTRTSCRLLNMGFNLNSRQSAAIRRRYSWLNTRKWCPGVGRDACNGRTIKMAQHTRLRSYKDRALNDNEGCK